MSLKKIAEVTNQEVLQLNQSLVMKVVADEDKDFVVRHQMDEFRKSIV